jgi:putative PIN family toxin of toxin-antitoxin system
MPSAVFDSTILVSAFLTPHGLCDQLLVLARRGAFDLYLSDAIIEETQEVLLERERIRQRYPYTDEQPIRFCRSLRSSFHLVTDPPPLSGVVRDPNDNMVIACALAAGGLYIVTYDKDLLDLANYQDVQMIRPEVFIRLARQQGHKP